MISARSYGSEAHLLRYRRDHPDRLDDAIRQASGLSGSVEWIYPRDLANRRLRARRSELHARSEGGLEVLLAYARFAAVLGCFGTPRRMLATHGAKANHSEFTGSPCGAKMRSEPRKQIEKALGNAKAALGVHRDFSWMGSYYQYANRLDALSFLREQRIDAPLTIYFYADALPDGRPCPASPDAWERLFEARDLTLGLSGRHALSDRVHHVLLQAPSDAIEEPA